VDIEKQLRSSVNPEVILGVDSLGVLFGDGAALADLRALAGNVEMDPLSREHAIRALGQAKDTESLTMFFNLLGDRAVYGCVITTLAEFDHPMTAKELISRMAGFKDGNRSLAIDTMASREIYALDLMDAIREGRVEAHELTAGQVRQLIALGNPEIKGFLEEKWGVVQETPEARLAAIEKWRNELTAENRSHADLENGAVLFRKACASCHRLFGEGKAIAPDLTGANRTNLEYLLMNIVDPGAVVPKQFTTSVINLKDGRVITGVVVSETDETLVVQTDKEQLTLVIDGIEDRHNTGKSLMPDGLLDSLTPEQVRDLFGYVMQQH
jgi:putative heme-binding domain-containing protein